MLKTMDRKPDIVRLLIVVATIIVAISLLLHKEYRTAKQRIQQPEQSTVQPTQQPTASLRIAVKSTPQRD